MTTLRVGYDLFAGPSQAGTESKVSGNLQAEVPKAGAYKVRVVRLSDNYYWNQTNAAFESGATAEADELDFEGSINPSGKPGGADRRLSMKIPKEVSDGITSAGFTATIYASGDTPSSEGADITLEFKPIIA